MNQKGFLSGGPFIHVPGGEHSHTHVSFTKVEFERGLLMNKAKFMPSESLHSSKRRQVYKKG